MKRICVLIVMLIASDVWAGGGTSANSYPAGNGANVGAQGNTAAASPFLLLASRGCTRTSGLEPRPCFVVRPADSVVTVDGGGGIRLEASFHLGFGESLVQIIRHDETDVARGLVTVALGGLISVNMGVRSHNADNTVTETRDAGPAYSGLETQVVPIY